MSPVLDALVTRNYPTKIDSMQPSDLQHDHLDHRKRRRNRTTQSCLNCHTSKRKCDRKRPCQRCIQLGLTGNCVYEVDDPSLRDNPGIDELTHLKSRIAELECVVRELRGKPNPKWTKPGIHNSYSHERWHSRSKRWQNPSIKHSSSSPSSYQCGSDDASTFPSTPLTPIKVEVIHERPMSPSDQLYHVTPSPTDTSAAESYPLTEGTDSDSYQTQTHFNHINHCLSFAPRLFVSPQHQQQPQPPQSYDSLSYHEAPITAPVQNDTPASESSPNLYYHRHATAVASPHTPLDFSRNTGFSLNIRMNGAPLVSRGSERSSYFDLSPCESDGAVPSYCPCRSSTGPAIAMLSHSLQNTMRALGTFPGHGQPQNTPCRLYRKVAELSDLLRCVTLFHGRRYPPTPVQPTDSFLD
jgi:hypothetical protein